MASNPPAECCTVGVKHEGESTGKLIKIGNNIEAYVAEPTGKVVHKNVAIIYIPDVYGIWQNSKLMVDQFAANGYYTVQPDVFNGDTFPEERPADFNVVNWIAKGTNGDNPHSTKEVDPIIAATVKHLKDAGYTKIGAVGYCFGGKYVCRFLAGKGVDVGYVAHPSFVDEDEIEGISGPFSISAAETDPVFPVEKRYKTEQILVSGKKVYQINLFSGVVHGFAVRCDLSDKTQKFAKEQAFLQAVNWFNQHLL